MVATSAILVLSEEIRLHKGTLCTKDDVRQKGQAKKKPCLKWSFQKISTLEGVFQQLSFFFFYGR